MMARRCESRRYDISSLFHATERSVLRGTDRERGSMRILKHYRGQRNWWKNRGCVMTFSFME